jgi:hypothetical protein
LLPPALVLAGTFSFSPALSALVPWCLRFDRDRLLIRQAAASASPAFLQGVYKIPNFAIKHLKILSYFGQR